eukprot:4567279-Pyramimonas_sp.AAC.1
MNSPVVEWPNRGLMDNPALGHFFGVLVEWLDKGLMSSSSPNLDWRSAALQAEARHARLGPGGGLR